MQDFVHQPYEGIGPEFYGYGVWGFSPIRFGGTGRRVNGTGDLAQE